MPGFLKMPAAIILLSGPSYDINRTQRLSAPRIEASGTSQPQLTRLNDAL